MNEAHRDLQGALSSAVKESIERNPNLQPIEIVAVIGNVAGVIITSAPNAAEMERARQSLIASMDVEIEAYMTQAPGARST